MGHGQNAPFSDEELLLALDLRDHEGLSFRQIAARFQGRTKNGIAGALHRVNVASRGDNGFGNGTMPRRWWKR